MKKRVISWLLCLALCLSMLPMAALAEDVQAPEGPAPSMNEPQPEPRAKENETPAPEPEKKVQSELMTAEKLLMPLAEDTPFTISFTATQNGDLITDEKPGVLSGGEVTLTVRIHLSDVSLRNDIIKAAQQSTLQVDNNNITFAGVGTEVNDTLVITITFAASSESHSVKYLITYDNQETTAECTLRFGVCSHLEAIEVNGKFKCTECGAALVAELTAGASSSATYYDTLEEALSAAQTEANSGCTVKLLADCSLSTYELQKGTFTLDFNGHTLKQINSFAVGGTANLTVKNDRSTAVENNGRFYLKSKTATLSLTIGSKYDYLMSYSGVGYILGPKMGYKVNNRNWADLNQLYRTYIENVTVAEYPFSTSDITVTPEDTYVNRKVTLSVTLDGLADGSEATCEYSVKTSASSGTTNSEGLGSFTLDTNRTFTTDYTPKVSECTICAQIKYRDFYVIKKLEKTFKTCTHDRVNQDTGYCDRCDSQMAASVSPTSYVTDRKYYETFDLAINAAWDMLKTSDCWFTMFENANVGGALNNEYVTGGHTLYMVMNGKTLTSSSVVFSVPKDRWKLNFRAVGDSPGGTLIGKSRDWGAIYVQSGGSLEIGSGKYTIQNTYSDTAASIVVHGSYGTYYTPGIATIYASEDSDLGNLLIMSGQVTVHGGTFKNATVSSPGGRLTVSTGRFTGDVTVKTNAWFYAGNSQAYFDGTVTINSDGGATLDGGNYKHLKVDGGRTLGSFMPNTLDMFKMGDVYLPHARNEAELTAGKDEYITIVRHTQHEYDEKGICSICNTQAEAKLYPEDGNYNIYEYGTIWKMLEKAQGTPGSCLVLLKDITLNSNTTISKGNFALSLGGKRLRCADSQNQIALVINGGEISIKDGTFDRLKVTDDGKLTLNGGKYYAIDVTDSTYANYGKLLATNRAFKHQSTWESKTSITGKSFDVTSTNAPKSVEKPPFDSVAVTPTICHLDSRLRQTCDVHSDGHQRRLQ